MSKQEKRFTFTDYSLDEKRIQKFWEDPKKVYSYICYGKETCPTTGKIHLQGYFETHTKRKFSAMCKRWSPNHLEIARGTGPENKVYCSKEGDFKEFGELMKQGQDSEINEIATKIAKKELKMSEWADGNFRQFHQYHRSVEKYLDMKLQENKRTWKTKLVVRFGKTGTNKSRWVWEKYPNLYKHKYNNGGFWQGYKGQEIVLLDEFRGQIPLWEMLDLTDRYPVDVQSKGKDNVPFLAKKIFICSPVPPEKWYKMEDKDGRIDQLLRRIDVRICTDIVEENPIEVADWEVELDK